MLFLSENRNWDGRAKCMFMSEGWGAGGWLKHDKRGKEAYHEGWRPERTLNKTLPSLCSLEEVIYFLASLLNLPPFSRRIREVCHLSHGGSLARHLPIFQCDLAAGGNISTSSRGPPNDGSRRQYRTGSIPANVSRAKGRYAMSLAVMIKVYLRHDLVITKHSLRLTIKFETKNAVD